MPTLLAILIAGAGAYLCNRQLVRRWGGWALLTVVPVAEELLKTGGAVLLGADLLLVHLGFGSIEAVADILQRPRPLPLIGYLAAGCSLIGHGAFAAVTLWGFESTGQLAMGLLLGCGLHLLWNAWVARLAQV